MLFSDLQTKLLVRRIFRMARRIRLRHFVSAGWRSLIWSVLVVGLPAFAQSVDNPRYRYSYTSEDAPPHIHFGIFVRKITFHDERYEPFRRARLSKIGIAPEDEEIVIAYFTRLDEQMEIEEKRSILRVACFDGAENLSSAAIRTVFNSFDDLRFSIDAKYFALASAELAAMGYTDFRERILSDPTSFGVFSTDHRFVWGSSDEDIQSTRLNICRNTKAALDDK